MITAAMATPILPSIFREHGREIIANSLYVIHLLYSVVSEGSEGVGITYRQEHSDSYDVLRSFQTNRFNCLDDLCECHNGLLTGVF